MSAIYTVSDGYPFGITDNSYGFCNATHVLADRPNLIGNPLPSGFHQNIQHWFDAGAFDFSGTCPVDGLVDTTGPGDPNKASGNSPRYFSTIRVAGRQQSRFLLQKDIRLHLGEQTRLTFQLDAFNLLNHPQFGAPNSDPTGTSFAAITTTSTNNGPCNSEPIVTSDIFTSERSRRLRAERGLSRGAAGDPNRADDLIANQVKIVW